MARLRRNVAGNTLAMAAAALIPLIAAVGGAVDMSRYYMATARLQAACDAGALAARKKMGDNVWEDDDRLHGLTFFDQNYPDEMFGLENLSRNYTADSNGTVTGTATGQLPTTLMQVFDFGQLGLSVECSAEINISNTDIMFVLDVTGSMNCVANDASCVNNGEVEASGSKIDGLRTAVIAFYDAVDGATSDTAQVRYGILPYSQNINVGRDIPTSYMASSMEHQSREAIWDISYEATQISFTVDSVWNRGADEYWYYWWNPNSTPGISTFAQCEAAANNSTLGFTDDYIDDSLQDATITIVSEEISGSTRTTVLTGRGRFTKANPVAWWSPCYTDLEYYRYYADFQATVVDEVQEVRRFDRWEYKNVTRDISTLYTNNTLAFETGSNGALSTQSWDGCILEADTVAATSFDPVPSGAYDLDINLIPSTEAEKWKPQFPNITLRRRSGGSYTNATTSNHGYYDNNGNLRSVSVARPYYRCPKAAQRLTAMSRSEMQNYISEANGFTAAGSTYHDMGMIWGARYISPRGIFSASNATAPNGDAIGRHIVFMTDGMMSTSNDSLTAYGMEWWDQRISGNGNGSTSSTNHSARFQAACKQARQENISVWVVAFGTSLTQNLTDCATPGRAFHASNSTELEDKFEEIAERIAALRLTQ